MQIRYAMSGPPASVPSGTTVLQVARHMAEAGVAGLPVMSDDHVVGMVTDRDLVVRALATGQSPQAEIDSVMSTDPVTLDGESTVPSALHTMRSARIRHLPVVSDGRLIGVVSLDDLLWQLSVQIADLALVVNATGKTPGPPTQ